MRRNLECLRGFVEAHPDAVLLFPVHPNPLVVEATGATLGEHDRIHLLDPLGYEEFLLLLSRAFLIVSDSGGVQEEAPSLGRPLLVLRGNTERPEALASGAARLAASPERLLALLEEAWQPGSWAEKATRIENPFGAGDAGARITAVLAEIFTRPRAEGARAALN
jgi:UDP-N-acetylglucosamine 2-epimerase (non-hydrolysing)